MITDEFINNIPSDFNLGVKHILTELVKLRQNKRPIITKYDEYVEFYFLLESYLSNNNYTFNKIELTGNEIGNLRKVNVFFDDLEDEFKKRTVLDKVNCIKKYPI